MVLSVQNNQMLLSRRRVPLVFLKYHQATGIGNKCYVSPPILSCKEVHLPLGTVWLPVTDVVGRSEPSVLEAPSYVRQQNSMEMDLMGWTCSEVSSFPVLKIAKPAPRKSHNTT